MTKEELLKHRSKVIAPFPGMNCDVGFIITKFYPLHFTVPMQVGGDKFDFMVRHGDMPHLFKPLPWWSDRKMEDMPDYIKVDGEVLNVEWYDDEDKIGNFYFADTKDTLGWYPGHKKAMPATKEEYEQQKQIAS